MLDWTKITFKTDESVKYKASGVYMIKFGSKHFYIGCSRNVTDRLRTHTANILTGRGGSKGIMTMNGFKGKVTFLLLEEVNQETHGEGWAIELFNVERKHINKRWRSKYCLNRHSTRVFPKKEVVAKLPVPCNAVAGFTITTFNKKRCLPCSC